MSHYDLSRAMREREHIRQRMCGIIIGLVVAAVGGMLISGCAQNSDQRTRQEQAQRTEQGTAVSPVTTQTQEQMAPKRQFVQIIQHPESPKVLTEDGLKDGEFPGMGAKTAATDDRSYTIGAITVNITEGGSQTPSLSGAQTGTATGTQTGAQTGTQSATQTPTQDIKPEISLSLNAAFAPGGMIDQLAAAVGKGSLSDLTKENQQDLRAAYIKGAQTGGFEQFAQLFAGLFPPPAAPTTQPGTP